MDNVLFGLGLLSLAGVIAFLVIAVVRIFKKKPRKNFVVAALICFVASNVFIFCGAQTNYNNMTPEERSEYDSKLAAESQLKEEKKASKDKSKDKNKTSAPPITEAAASQNIGDVSVQALKLYADLSDEQAQKVINDFKKVGISTPIYFESLSSNSTDKSFKFSNDKISGTLVVSNGKTSYISSGGVELFNSKKGGALANIEDYYLSSYESNYYKGMAEQHVKQYLKTPSAASFPDLTDTSAWIVSRYKDTVTVSAWVDSQNSYGAQLRSDFVIQMSYASQGTSLTYAEIEDKVLYGSFVSY